MKKVLVVISVLLLICACSNTVNIGGGGVIIDMTSPLSKTPIPQTPIPQITEEPIFPPSISFLPNIPPDDFSEEDEWTREKIEEFYEQTGKISDTFKFDFTFGDSRETVLSEFGKEAVHNPGWDYHSWRDQIWIIYSSYDYENLPQYVDVVLLWTGESLFGIEIGKSSVEEVKRVFGEPDWEDYAMGEYMLGSPSEPDDGDYSRFERFWFLSYKLSDVAVGFYFTDGILMTAELYAQH